MTQEPEEKVDEVSFTLHMGALEFKATAPLDGSIPPCTTTLRCLGYRKEAERIENLLKEKYKNAEN